jgi:tetratricopeptide (TPR) repeat protein
MRALSAVILLATLWTARAFCSGALEHDFQKANEHYQNSEYEKAIEDYEKVLAGGVDNAALHYNLGNAYFKTGRLGLAIASYYRALKLDPRNDDIRANLDYAKQFLVDRVDTDAQSPIWEWYRSFVLNYTANEWALFATILFFICGALLSFMIWTRRFSGMLKGIFAATVVITVCAAVCTGANVEMNYLMQRGAIVVPEVSVRVGPGDDFDEQFLAHEGLTFNIVRQESGWYLGVFANRLKGWVKLSDAVKI